MKRNSTHGRIMALVLAVMLALTLPVAGLADSAEPTTLKWITVGDKLETSAFQAVWAEVNNMLLRDLNAQIELEFIGWTDVASQLALRYASGSNDFDFTYMGADYKYADLANKNAFAELTDEMMETYMPGTWAQVPEEFWDQARINGKLYLVPFNSPRFDAASLAIRGDLREKYGIEPLASLDDFNNFLKTIAANEPTMQAIYDADLSFYLNSNGVTWKSLGGATAAAVNFEIGSETNDIFSMYFTDEYVEYAKWARELAEAGCWPEDSISNTQVAVDLFDSGATAAFCHNLTTVEMRGINSLAAGYDDWNVELYDFCSTTKKSVQSCLGNGTTFNPNSKNLTLAMQVVDKFYSSKEYNELIMYGFEGKNWEDVGEGLYRDLDNTLPEDEQYKGSWYASWCWVNRAVERQEDIRYGAYPEILADYEANMVVSKLDSFSFVNAGVSTETATLTDVVTMYEDPISFGMFDDPEAAVEEFRAALIAAGYDAYMAAVQEQVDAFLASR